MSVSQPDPQQQQQHAGAQPLQQPAQQDSAFPLKEVLLSSGVLSVIGMFYFYKKKQTLPFKVCVVGGVSSHACPSSRAALSNCPTFTTSMQTT
jgi:hypothetical protein